MFDIGLAPEEPLVNFPRATAATTVQALREEIAAQAEVPVDQVHVKSYMFRAQSSSVVDMERQGTVLTQSSGYQLRTSWDMAQSQQSIRVCDFNERKEPMLKGELVVDLDETVLVPIDLGTRRAILAVHAKVISATEWEEHYQSIQQQFFAEAEANIVEPRWDSHEVQTRRDCE